MNTRTAPPPFATVAEKNDPLKYLSASRLKSYLTCPLKFYFEKVLAIPKPTSPAAHLGKAVHAGLAIYHGNQWRGGETSPLFVASRFAAEFNKLEGVQPVKWDEPGDRVDALESGAKLIHAYIADSETRPTEKPIGIEVSLEAEIPGIPIPLVGIADLVREGNKLTDFKTTGVTPNPLIEAWQHELQVTAYDLLIEDNTGQRVSEAELVFLVKTKTPKIIRQKLPAPDDTQRARFKALAWIYVNGVQSKNYYPCPGQHCAWCPFKAECRQWKGPERRYP
jgi:putative RecB family exonuclease